MEHNITRKNNKKLIIKLIFAPILMFAFAYALVPIYNVLCEITGFNGTTGRIDKDENYIVDKTLIDENREVNISFFADTASGFPVKFYPKQTNMSVVPGKFYTMSYIAENNTDKVVVGQAVPSVAPTDAALNFKKLECFCFNRQEFKPGEKVEMSLRFIVEPEMKQHIKNVSLSYNFFKLDS